jgi:hypothetical protein
MPATRSTQRWQTFSPVLHRWSARLSLKPHLASITLDNVLAGDTCEPIRLVDLQPILLVWTLTKSPLASLTLRVILLTRLVFLSYCPSTPAHDLLGTLFGEFTICSVVSGKRSHYLSGHHSGIRARRTIVSALMRGQKGSKRQTAARMAARTNSGYPLRATHL